MDQIQQQNHGELVELRISCRGLKNLNNLYLSDPVVYVYLEGADKQPVLVGHTEVSKHNLNPDFRTPIRMTYHFNKVQTLLINVYDSNESLMGKLTEIALTGQRKENFMGSVRTSLTKLMGAPNSLSKLVIQREGSIYEGTVVIFVDKCRGDAESATKFNWQWGGKELLDMDFFSKSDPFAKFYRQDPTGQRLLVHETEVIKDDLNPKWKPWLTDSDELCPKNDKFFVEVFDYDRVGGHDFIGSTEISLSSIVDGGQTEFKLLTHKGKKAGILRVLNLQVTKPQPIKHEITFLDYLRGGWQLSLVAGIDFTFSNGPLSKADSLHKVGTSKENYNQYQQTIKYVGGTIISFDHDKLVPVYGFGGVPKLPTYNKKYAEDCFPVNGNKDNPTCKDIAGILQAYAEAVPNIEFSGPTFISSILRNAKKQTEENAQNDIYTVVIIMTDGQIEDMNDALQIISEMCSFPVSIVIVGVGDDNFSYMHIMDNPEEIKKHAKPEYKDKVRDIVQFVAFKEFNYNVEKLAGDVLDNFPKQFMDYMNRNGIKPRERDAVALSKVQV